jgi:hypothetical protein
MGAVAPWYIVIIVRLNMKFWSLTDRLAVVISNRAVVHRS